MMPFPMVSFPVVSFSARSPSALPFSIATLPIRHPRPYTQHPHSPPPPRPLKGATSDLISPSVTSVWYTYPTMTIASLSITDLLRQFPTDVHAEQWFEEQRWPHGRRICPDCQSDNIAVVKSRKPMPYRCRTCRRHFSVRKGMVMQSSKLGYQNGWWRGGCGGSVGGWIPAYAGMTGGGPYPSARCRRPERLVMRRHRGACRRLDSGFRRNDGWGGPYPAARCRRPERLLVRWSGPQANELTSRGGRTIMVGNGPVTA